MRSPERVPFMARVPRKTIRPVVTIDCSITERAVPSILGTIIVGCLLQVQ